MPRNPDDKRADLFGDEAPPQRRVAKGSLAILNEQDFERLRAAMAKEAARRGRKIRPNLVPAEEERPRPTPDGVTAARANLVRAAFKAGVKPLAIARQFGLTQATVRELLKSLKPGT